MDRIFREIVRLLRVVAVYFVGSYSSVFRLFLFLISVLLFLSGLAFILAVLMLIDQGVKEMSLRFLGYAGYFGGRI